MEIGKWLIFTGFTISVFGLIFFIFADKLGLLGNLFGDLKYESKNIKIFFPFTSMLIISIIISIIINIISKFFR